MLWPLRALCCRSSVELSAPRLYPYYASFVSLTLVIATVVGCDSENVSAPEPTNGDPVFVGAGDIADCEMSGDEATAELIANIDGTVFTLGDNAYPRGSAANFADCYEPTWGREKHRTKPVPGNNDYVEAGAAGYFDYFGSAAGDPGKGYYSYDLGQWHLVALNSNCEQVGGCIATSAQVRWLEDDLAANEYKDCTLAYFHHPLFSSGGIHGNTPEMKPIWEALYAAGADVVLSAHEHNYQRFAPQDPSGTRESEQGIRAFVVGTGGGKGHYKIESPIENTEVYNDDTYGVLKLTLHPSGYDWQFVPVEGEAFTDSGSEWCY